jgi:hypothetical protein
MIYVLNCQRSVQFSSPTAFVDVIDSSYVVSIKKLEQQWEKLKNWADFIIPTNMQSSVVGLNKRYMSPSAQTGA